VSRKPVAVLGAGRAGRRAVALLTGLGFSRLTVIDPDPEALARLPQAVKAVAQDGVQWLARAELDSAGLKSAWVIPALPVHLAYEWLLARMGSRAARAAVPGRVSAGLPGLAPAGREGRVISWSQDLCPADCDERGICPKLGRRLDPLYGLLRQRAQSLPLAVVRSHPLGPGLGGFPTAVLLRLERRIEALEGVVAVATACRCFGVIHALKMNQGGLNVTSL